MRALPRLMVAGLALAAVSTVLPGVAAADKRPSIAEVQQRVDALDAQADQAVEEYAQARLRLQEARRRSAVAQARVRRENAELAAVRTAMASVAASAYRSGGRDPMLSLVSTSTPQTFLDQASSLDRIARGQAQRLAAVATARHRLAEVQADADRALAEQKADETSLARKRASIETTLRASRDLLAGLKAEERARLEAARQAAARQAARASRSRAASLRSSYDGPATGRAAAAVAEAYAKLGSPYVWAAAGPSTFDCSGLTMWAWARGGVSLPHSSQLQYSVTRRVSRDDVQPGDLVFFGSPIHHVGIYIGDGNMISAPHTGDVVKIQYAFRGDYVGAGRP